MSARTGAVSVTDKHGEPKTAESIEREVARIHKQICRLYNTTITVREIERLLWDLRIARGNELRALGVTVPWED
jgi:hypothetical protein